MPELPEVEMVRRGLLSSVRGRTLHCSYAHESSKFAAAAELTGQGVVDICRRGKYLIAALDDGREFIVHLGMTGALLVDPLDRAGPHVRAVWHMDSGQDLVFNDVRRFGRLAVVVAGDYSELPTLRDMGPEPLSDAFDGAVLHALTVRSSSHIKTQLLSQRPVAGVGNIYADEALWMAQIHPRCRQLSKPRAERLATAIQEVLSEAIDHGGTTLSDYRQVDGSKGQNQKHLHCYGRAGELCDRCGTELSRTVMQGRGTTFCRKCQSY